MCWLCSLLVMLFVFLKNYKTIFTKFGTYIFTAPVLNFTIKFYEVAVTFQGQWLCCGLQYSSPSDIGLPEVILAWWHEIQLWQNSRWQPVWREVCLLIEMVLGTRHCRLNFAHYFVQATVETSSEDRVTKINELERHTSRMAQVIQQMESRFDSHRLLT